MLRVFCCRGFRKIIYVGKGLSHLFQQVHKNISLYKYKKHFILSRRKKQDYKNKRFSPFLHIIANACHSQNGLKSTGCQAKVLRLLTHFFTLNKQCVPHIQVN